MGASSSLLPFPFINKNCVGRKGPREFDPLDLAFSDHARWLATAWAGCLVELHALFDLDHEFSVGFLFSEDSSADFAPEVPKSAVSLMMAIVFGLPSEVAMSSRMVA